MMPFLPTARKLSAFWPAVLLLAILGFPSARGGGSPVPEEEEGVSVLGTAFGRDEAGARRFLETTLQSCLNGLVGALEYAANDFSFRIHKAAEEYQDELARKLRNESDLVQQGIRGLKAWKITDGQLRALGDLLEGRATAGRLSFAEERAAQDFGRTFFGSELERDKYMKAFRRQLLEGLAERLHQLGENSHASRQGPEQLKARARELRALKEQENYEEQLQILLLLEKAWVEGDDDPKRSNYKVTGYFLGQYEDAADVILSRRGNQ